MRERNSLKVFGAALTRRNFVKTGGAMFVGFGMIGAAWALGFTVGPAIGGLLGEIGPRAPF